MFVIRLALGKADYCNHAKKLWKRARCREGGNENRYSTEELATLQCSAGANRLAENI